MSSDSQSLWKPLEHRDWAILWAGLLTSQIGDSVQLHAQSWIVTELTNSATLVGAVALAQAIPRLFLGLFAGVLVDRFDRRRTLLVTQTFALAQTLVFLLLVLSHHLTYAAVVALAALLGVVDTLNLNARMSLLPNLLPRDLLARSIALQALGVNVVQIAGPSLSGIFLSTTGIAGALLFNALTFLVSLFSLTSANTPNTSNTPSTRFSEELREGFAFVRERPLLRNAILLAWIHGLLGVSTVRLLALWARQTVGTTGSGYGMLVSATGIGAILASAIVTARARPAKLPRNMAFFAAFFSCSLIVLSFTKTYASAFAALLAFGFGQMAFRSAVTTTIQLETPDRLRGRVISLLTLDFSLWSIGAMLTGGLVDRLASLPMASHASPRPLSWALSTAFFLLGILCFLFSLLLGRTLATQTLSTEKS